MGVKGLLPLLKSIQKPCHLKQFAGSTLGVDAYGWLHRGTISCAIELAQGQPTTRFVDFAMGRVRMLIHFGIKPYLVFDGDYLPSKKETEKDRAAKRREAKAAGLELLRMGRKGEAYRELQKGIDVTPEMARQLMDELDKANVDFVVAPYEADPQLVYLEKKGLIQGILSEDSDMLVFGANLLLTKLDQFGECVSICRKDFTACKDISLVGWSDDEFRWMSILSGCDYLAPIGNVGLKTAYSLIRKHKTVERTVKALQFDGKSKIAVGYLDAFRQAELTFQHQWVYCSEAKRMVHLNDLKAGTTADQMPYIGREVEASIAGKTSRGLLHPHSKEPLRSRAQPMQQRNKPLDKAMQQTRTPLKKVQSIESFFKPKRTPLAELDPNMFTPSPSQQRLLEQQQQEWPATEVLPRPTLFRAMTEATRSQSTRRVSELQTPFDHLSAKRQRLCSDSAIAIAMTGSAKATPAHSRFFSGPSSLYSPSVGKASRKGLEQKAEVNIWSDDSIEDAMSRLEEAAMQTAKPSAKKLQVFRDDDATESATSTSQDDSQPTLVDTATWSQDTDHAPADEYTVPDSDPGFDDVGDVDEEEWAAAASRPLKPLSVTKELNIYSLEASKDRVSDDQLVVPNSDGEEEEVVQRVRPTFGVGLDKFVFSG